MDMLPEWQALRDAADTFFSCPLSDTQCRQMMQLYDLVGETNRTMNLTRITSLEDFCTLHLLDSLSLVPHLKTLPADFSLADVGSGAGFPALPLAIVFPEARILAVESVQKKARFIETAAATLGLPHVTVSAQRSEDLARQQQTREQFDVVTARAVAALNVLAELCIPMVRPGGRFMAMKTQDAAQAELPAAQHALSLLGCGPCEIVPVTADALPNRCLVIAPKTAPTPPKYPRLAGTARKKPLS